MFFRQAQEENGFPKFFDSLNAEHRNNGSKPIDGAIVRGLAGMESFQTPVNIDAGRSKFQALRTSISAKFAEAFGIDPKSLTPAQLDNAALAHMISSSGFESFREYGNAATTVKTTYGNGPKVPDGALVFHMGFEDVAGADLCGYRTVANEAFDARETENHLAFNTGFALQAAKQNPFSEAFFPTTIVTPDQAGLIVQVTRVMVFNEQLHDYTGKPIDENFKSTLFEAEIDYKILANDSTTITPVFIPNVNQKYFSSVVTPYSTITGMGESVLTAPLRPGMTIDLIGIGQTPKVAQTGVSDYVDSLDIVIKLKQLYVAFRSTSANAGGIIKFPVERLPFTQFQRRVEGYDLDFTLNYTTKDLRINYLTNSVKDPITNAVTLDPNFAFLNTTERQKYEIRLSTHVSGLANTERGDINVSPAVFNIDSVWELTRDANGKVVSSVKISDQTILDALSAEFPTFTLDGYDVVARRSNIARRQKGILTTNTLVQERYTIPLGSPVTAQNPVTSTRTNIDMGAPITVLRVRNDNIAVTTLLSYADQLEAWGFSNTDRSQPVPAVPGIGRWVVRPFFERIKCNVYQRLNTIKSQDRRHDISAVFVQTIREVAYRMKYYSGWGAAVKAQNGGNAEEPVLVIGTNPIVEQHMIVDGDTRLGSVGLTTELVTTLDRRLENKIILAFKRAQATATPDPLNIGTMGMMTEVASNIPQTQNGNVTQMLIVQNRTLHIPLCPILAMIDVEDLDKAVALQVPVPMKTVV